MQVFHVVRSLQHPEIPGPLPVEHLEDLREIAVRGKEGLPLEPCCVCRHVQDRFRRLARERVIHEQDVFLGRVGFDWVDGEELRRDARESTLRELPLDSSTKGSVAPLAGERSRAKGFPSKEGARARISGEQPVEHGRPRPLQARDDDGSYDPRCLDLGEVPRYLLDPKAIFQHSDQASSYDHSTERVFRGRTGHQSRRRQSIGAPNRGGHGPRATSGSAKTLRA